MPVVFRRPVAADAERHLALLRALDVETRFLLWEPGERLIDADALRRHFSTLGEEAELLIADAGERIVGFLSAKRGGTRRLRHRADFSMGVLADCRKQGIGRRLLEELEAWARRRGVTRLELTVMAHNQSARQLYERMGYATEGVKVGAIRIGSEPIDEIVMGKLLDAPA